MLMWVKSTYHTSALTFECRRRRWMTSMRTLLKFSNARFFWPSRTFACMWTRGTTFERRGLVDDVRRFVRSCLTTVDGVSLNATEIYRCLTLYHSPHSNAIDGVRMSSTNFDGARAHAKAPVRSWECYINLGLLTPVLLVYTVKYSGVLWLYHII